MSKTWKSQQTANQTPSKIIQLQLNDLPSPNQQNFNEVFVYEQNQRVQLNSLEQPPNLDEIVELRDQDQNADSRKNSKSQVKSSNMGDTSTLNYQNQITAKQSKSAQQTQISTSPQLLCETDQYIILNSNESDQRMPIIQQQSQQFLQYQDIKSDKSSLFSPQSQDIIVSRQDQQLHPGYQRIQQSEDINKIQDFIPVLSSRQSLLNKNSKQKQDNFCVQEKSNGINSKFEQIEIQESDYQKMNKISNTESQTVDIKLDSFAPSDEAQIYNLLLNENNLKSSCNISLLHDTNIENSSENPSSTRVSDIVSLDLKQIDKSQLSKYNQSSLIENQSQQSSKKKSHMAMMGMINIVTSQINLQQKAQSSNLGTVGKLVSGSCNKSNKQPQISHSSKNVINRSPKQQFESTAFSKSKFTSSINSQYKQSTANFGTTKAITKPIPVSPSFTSQSKVAESFLEYNNEYMATGIVKKQNKKQASGKSLSKIETPKRLSDISSHSSSMKQSQILTPAQINKSRFSYLNSSQKKVQGFNIIEKKSYSKSPARIEETKSPSNLLRSKTNIQQDSISKISQKSRSQSQNRASKQVQMTNSKTSSLIIKQTNQQRMKDIQEFSSSPRINHRILTKNNQMTQSVNNNLLVKQLHDFSRNSQTFKSSSYSKNQTSLRNQSNSTRQSLDRAPSSQISQSAQKLRINPINSLDFTRSGLHTSNQQKPEKSSIFKHSVITSIGMRNSQVQLDSQKNKNNIIQAHVKQQSKLFQNQDSLRQSQNQINHLSSNRVQPVNHLQNTLSQDIIFQQIPQLQNIDKKKSRQKLRQLRSHDFNNNHNMLIEEYQIQPSRNYYKQDDIDDCKNDSRTYYNDENISASNSVTPDDSIIQFDAVNSSLNDKVERNSLPYLGGRQNGMNPQIQQHSSPNDSYINYLNDEDLRIINQQQPVILEASNSNVQQDKPSNIGKKDQQNTPEFKKCREFSSNDISPNPRAVGNRVVSSLSTSITQSQQQSQVRLINSSKRTNTNQNINRASQSQIYCNEQQQRLNYSTSQQSKFNGNAYSNQYNSLQNNTNHQYKNSYGFDIPAVAQVQCPQMPNNQYQSVQYDSNTMLVDIDSKFTPTMTQSQLRIPQMQINVNLGKGNYKHLIVYQDEDMFEKIYLFTRDNNFNEKRKKKFYEVIRQHIAKQELNQQQQQKEQEQTKFNNEGQFGGNDDLDGFPSINVTMNYDNIFRNKTQTQQQQYFQHHDQQINQPDNINSVQVNQMQYLLSNNSVSNNSSDCKPQSNEQNIMSDDLNLYDQINQDNFKVVRGSQDQPILSKGYGPLRYAIQQVHHNQSPSHNQKQVVEQQVIKNNNVKSQDQSVSFSNGNNFNNMFCDVILEEYEDDEVFENDDSIVHFQASL